jgi:integrase
MFSMPEGGKMDANNFARTWQRAVTESGTEVSAEQAKPVPYSLRHTHASTLLASGWSPAEAAARLGHKRQATLLDHYSHTFPNGERPQPGFFLSRICQLGTGTVVALPR